jgi:acetyl esterase/lipase
MEVHQKTEALPGSSLRRRRFLRASVTALSLTAVWAAAKPAAAIIELGRHDTTVDIPYGGGARQKLDVYEPRNAAGAPVIVFFYGGRWQSGTKGWYRIFAATLAARGYVVVIPDYRLYPEVKFPEFIADGASALRWTHENIARFHGDPGRVFVMGHSAGAYIAAMLALDPRWLQQGGLNAGRDIAGLIGVSGPYDFLPLRDPVLIDLFGGADRPATQPISFAEGRKPPALLLTGAQDDIVDPGNSTRLAGKLRRNGNDAAEVTYPRFGHMTILAALAPVLANFFPLMDDVDAFVGRAQPAAAQGGVSLGAGARP